jgi:isopenicillin-N epimerase
MLDRRRIELMAVAKDAVGRFLGMAPANFAFLTNATGAVDAVIRSLPLEPGDELLTTTHVYNAVRLGLRHVAARAGGTYRELELPMPMASPRDIVKTVEAALSPRTRLLVIDHITSPTAVIMPVKEIVAMCAARGLDVLIDGAHAPGMIQLDVEAIGAAYYAGNLHKWVSAPKGAAFLWVRPDRQAGIHANTISHNYDQGFAFEFSWQGTRDITPWLCARDAIEFFEQRFGWSAVTRHNHEMALWAQAMLVRRWGVEPATPVDGSMIGSMATMPLPEGARTFPSTDAFQALLYSRHHIEVPVIDWGGRWWLRASCHVYNNAEEYERLGDAVLDLLG